MKSLMHLCEKVLLDLGDLCCVSTIRDRQTIEERVKHEGLSFLTITLPAFCRDFERALDLGDCKSIDFLGFSKKGRLPRFLGGFFDLVFDRLDGRIRTCPSTHAIFAIRQACLQFKKFRADCTPSRVKSCLENYVLTDIDLGDLYETIPDYYLEAASKASRALFQPVLSGLERGLSDPRSVIPRHGPGTTSCGTKANRKYDHLGWTDRLHEWFAASDFVIPSWNDDRYAALNQYRPGREPPVRVVTVPKTLKTPRIIAIEPVHMQYVQQGIMEKLVPCLESRLMFDSIGFTDQSVSQRLAQQGSIDGLTATIDLSEASDRVSNQFVIRMLDSWPTLSGMVQACRSTSADVPGYGVIPLAKFASMGSALCFPIEAMVFLTIIFLSQHGHLSYYKMKNRRESFLRQVRVYGDDIVIPVEWMQSVSRELTTFGLKVNQHKSFGTGKFRESCGGDYYDGVSVKPTYIKCDIPTTRHQVPEVTATVKFRNLIYKEGMWRTAKHIDQCIRNFAPFPVVSDTSPLLGRYSFLGVPTERVCKNLHRPIAFGMVAKRTKPSSPLDGYGALMKFFLKRGSDPIFSKDHLERDGRPKVVAMNLRWASSF
jgi:hypothetical protein